MHIIETVSDKDQIKNDSFITMFVTFPEATVDKADRLDIWGSDFNECEEDFCEYRLMKGDKALATKRIKGY